MNPALADYKRLTDERREAGLVGEDELCDSLDQQLSDIWWDQLTLEERAQVNPYDRPDYIKCVFLSGNEANATSVCGRKGFLGWLFTGWEHADANAAQKGRLLTCEQCLAKRNELNPSGVE